MAGRGDSPALTRGLRVVVSPGGDEYKMLPAAAPPLVADATTFAPLGSMSLDFRVAMLPYKSSSFATPQAGAQQPALGIEQFLRLLFNEALLSHRSAGGRWCRKAPKGGKPPKVANLRNGILAYESLCIIPNSAGFMTHIFVFIGKIAFL